jgi:hypothetical protein
MTFPGNSHVVGREHRVGSACHWILWDAKRWKKCTHDKITAIARRADDHSVLAHLFECNPRYVASCSRVKRSISS